MDISKGNKKKKTLLQDATLKLLALVGFPDVPFVKENRIDNFYKLHKMSVRANVNLLLVWGPLTGKFQCPTPNLSDD